jgi:NAD(P)-dependent dehydrogenase (short-subunit alcohol dehydrogenase family)
MSGEFAGLVTLVTGAASGIGRATAEAFAREGAHVVIADIDRAGGEATVARIVSAGGKATFQRCDVTDVSSVEAMSDQVRRTFGRLDCAVNDVGIDPEVTPEPSWDLEVFERVHATNVRGVFLCMKAEIALMLPRGAGAIVNLGSVAAVAGLANKPSYVSSKHAVLGLTRSAALQYAKRGIRVNAVCPGPVRTSMLQANLDVLADGGAQITTSAPLGRIAEPQEIADNILWLCSKRSSYIVGHGLLVDGGFTV